MKLMRREGTLAHAHDVLRDVSDITLSEMIATWGTGDWWPVGIRTAKEFLAAGPADTMLEGEKALAIFGHMPHAESYGSRITWFFGSRRYFELGPRGVVFTRRYLAHLQREYPTTRFATYTLSRHPDVERWFRALGYSQIADYRDGGGGLGYVLSPKAAV